MSSNPTLDTSFLEKPRRRLLRQYHHLKSYQKLADARGVNVAYVHDFLVHGIVPASKDIQHALGLRIAHKKTIQEHLATDSIQDMPTDLLRWAFEYREEMQ